MCGRSHEWAKSALKMTHELLRDAWQEDGAKTSISEKRRRTEVKRLSYPRLISDLTEEERKSVEECIRVLPKVFRECEDYLREYEANDATVFKLLQAIKVVAGAITYSPCGRTRRNLDGNCRWCGGV